MARSQPARVLAIGIVILAAASAWPVTYYGENAYQRVREISDPGGQHWLDEHMERADKLVYAFYVTALLGVAALVSQKKFPKAAAPLAVATLIASAASLGVGGWISKAGGQIRHAEFRASAPASNTVTTMK